MKLEDLNKETENILLTKEQKQSLLKLIDLKTEDNMEKVLDKMDSKFSAIEAKFSGIEAKFSSIDTKFEGLRSEIIGFKEGINHKIDGQQKSIYIIIAGLVFAIIGFFLKR